MDLVPSFDQMQRELHFDGVVRAAFQHLVTDPGPRLGIRLVHGVPLPGVAKERPAQLTGSSLHLHPGFEALFVSVD